MIAKFHRYFHEIKAAIWYDSTECGADERKFALHFLESSCDDSDNFRQITDQISFIICR